MSAAEKLKALDPTRRFFPEGRWADFDGTFVNVDAAVALTAALPQIVAVVEAAENISGIRSGAWPDLASALAALDEVLS